MNILELAVKAGSFFNNKPNFRITTAIKKLKQRDDTCVIPKSLI
jgi:hypothetical protein